MWFGTHSYGGRVSDGLESFDCCNAPRGGVLHMACNLANPEQREMQPDSFNFLNQLYVLCLCASRRGFSWPHAPNRLSGLEWSRQRLQIRRERNDALSVSMWPASRDRKDDARQAQDSACTASAQTYKRTGWVVELCTEHRAALTRLSVCDSIHVQTLSSCSSCSSAQSAPAPGHCVRCMLELLLMSADC
jgi:hypothetical protein